MADTLIIPASGSLTAAGKYAGPQLGPYQLNGTDVTAFGRLPPYQLNGTDSNIFGRLGSYQLNGTDAVTYGVFPTYQLPGGNRFIQPGVTPILAAGGAAVSTNSGNPNSNIAPATGVLVTTGAAGTAVVFSQPPVVGALALAGIAPVMGRSGFTSASLRKLSGYSTASQSGGIGAAILRKLRSTGTVNLPVATGAATMRKMSGLGYGQVVGAPVLRKVRAVGTAAGAAIGAATLRAIRSQSMAGLGNIRKLQGAGSAAATLVEQYRVFVMNTSTNAVSEYTNHRFNSFAEIGGAYYGAGPDGFTKLDGTTDAGANINWQVRTGQMDDKQPGLKRLPEVVLGLRASGPVRVRVWPNDNEYYDYMLPNVKTNTIRQHRVKPGKGMESRYFAVELQGVSNSAIELDSLMVNMTQTTRRIG